MASDAARGVVDFGGEAFGAAWARVIHPVIKDEYEELLNTVPLRMRVKQDNRFERGQEGRQGGRGHHSEKMCSVMEEVRSKLERRNVHVNLACQIQVTTRVCR